MNNAAGTGRVVNFTPTPPVTPIISSGFGFGTAASTTAPAAAANEKAAPPAAAANKTSAPPVANTPVPIVSLKPAAKPTVQSSASSASESALRSVVNTPNKSTTRINARSSRKKGANLLRSTIGSARRNGGLSSKQLFEDTENIIPSTIGGEDDDNTCNFLSGLFQEFFTEAVEEVSLMGFSQGTDVSKDVTLKDSVSMNAEVDNLCTGMMHSLLNLRGTDNKRKYAKALGFLHMEKIQLDATSVNFQTMLDLVAEQESVRNAIIERARATYAVLERKKKSITPTLSTGLEEAANSRDAKKKALQDERDRIIDKATLKYEESCAAEDSKYESSKAQANTDAKATHQTLSEEMENARDEVSRTEKGAITDLLKSQSIVKAIKTGHIMLAYNSEVDSAALNEDEKAERERKADLIYNQLVNHMQPAIAANNHTDMMNHVINWHFDLLSDL